MDDGNSLLDWVAEMSGTAHLVQVIPLLFDPGDHLGREEFLARWEQMPELKFAELIDEMVYLPSPVGLEHGRRNNLLQFWGGRYASQIKVVVALTNATWLMLES